jgi:hypothetical protein
VTAIAHFLQEHFLHVSTTLPTIFTTITSLNNKQCNKTQISLKAPVSKREQKNKYILTFTSHAANEMKSSFGSGYATYVAKCDNPNLTKITY